MVGGKGQTIPDMVGPRGVDNATNPELVCLPYAQLGNQLGSAPTQKKVIAASRNGLKIIYYLRPMGQVYKWMSNFTGTIGKRDYA